MMLKIHLEEARRIEETLEDQKKCLEAKIVAQKEEVENREKVLTYHLKEKNEDLNQLEEEIITLKIQLEETKRKEEFWKSQIIKKEEEFENIEK
jgi:hypothetical protein